MAGTLLTQLILVSIAVIAVVYAKKARLGFDGFNCASPGGKQIIPCHNDCVLEHNAKYGWCQKGEDGDDFTCHCSEPLNTLQNGSIQCVKEDNPVYLEICEIDCFCNHGATKAVCNYETHACECYGKAGDMKLCKYPTHHDMIRAVIAKKAPKFPIDYDAETGTLIFDKTGRDLSWW